MKKLIIAAAFTFPVFAFAAQPQQETITRTQADALQFSHDAAGTTFVAGTLADNLNFGGQASLTEQEDVAVVLVPAMAQELNRKQAAESSRIGAISASGAATPDDLDDLLMAKAEQQGASGYRITSVSSMSPYSGTATLYR
ncbi:DUF1471 domain-containing protein [Scandinavium sp. NPDC088450]|uniref:DUF1471 domain-containing protein n=1 Tax=Scandinavium sp. NPDC088450 TaxID=3364514 RepID=UPI00384CAFB1